MNIPKRTRDILVVGFALFAMFLGAANIIFPPFMGAMSGKYWYLACLGFVITGTGLPVLGIVAAAKAGGTVDGACGKVSPRFSKILNVLLVIFIGPLFAVPRTAATTVELTVVPFIPQDFPLHPKFILAAASLLFFSICLFFILNPSNAIDRIGTVLTPFLVVFLFTLIFLAIFAPIDRPVDPAPGLNRTKIFHFGFTTGYQTMDAIGAILFGGTIFKTLLSKGYSRREVRRMMWPVALVCGTGTFSVYLGFAWIGASGSSLLQGISEKTALTVQAVRALAGLPGQILLALIIFLACCTTAIGLIMAASDYFVLLFRRRFSYKTVALTLTVISYLISILGVEGIILLAAPVLELLYPVVIILIALNLLGDRVRYRSVYKAALLAAAPVAVLNVLRLFFFSKPFADAWLPYFPLGDAGFGCFIPAVLGAFFGDWLAKSRALTGRLPSSWILPPSDPEDTAPQTTDTEEIAGSGGDDASLERSL